MNSLPIDLHLEIGSLRNFINDHIEQGNLLLFDGKNLYESLKRVVIGSEIRPFLTFPKDESENSYYDRYVRQSREPFDKLIPDFFEYQGEFYDLDKPQYVNNEFISSEDFERLFIIKLLELKTISYPIDQFLSFQQFDNFYGEKYSIDSFLYQLTENDGNRHHLQEVCQAIESWISIENLVKLKSTSIEDDSSELLNRIIQNSPPQITWMKQLDNLKGKEIESKWNIDQIVYYFSFLYKEKSENGQSFLKKEEVDKIFEQGFRMPGCDIDPLFKLNLSERLTFSLMHFAIYQFNDKAGFRRIHKKQYLLFFASYIQDLSKYKYSKKFYESYSKNTYNSNSSLSSIDWSNYLPG
jgi:hypothetical protein